MMGILYKQSKGTNWSIDLIKVPVLLKLIVINKIVLWIDLHTSTPF